MLDWQVFNLHLINEKYSFITLILKSLDKLLVTRDCFLFANFIKLSYFQNNKEGNTKECN